VAINDIRIKSPNRVPVRTYQTEAGATDIKAGEFVKQKAAGSPYVIPLADAEPVIGTTTAVVGLAKSNSTHTGSGDGTIDVYIPVPGVVYEIKAKSSTAADTEAEIKALEGDRLLIDLTSSTYTIDTAAGDSQTAGFYVVGGDANRKTIHVMLRSGATIVGDQDLS